LAGLTIQSLRDFVALVNEGSFSAAAKRLGVTQPAISAQIKTLEDHFGAQLVERAGRVWRPTPAGERLFGHASQIAGIAEAMEGSMSNRLEGPSGGLQIAASTVPGEFLLPKLMGEFCERYPAVQVSVKVSDSATAVDDLLLKRSAVALIGAEPPLSKIRTTPFGTDELLLVAPPGHDLAGDRKIALDDLVFQSWVLRERGSGSRAAITRTLASVGLDAERLPVVLELGSTSAVKRAVKAGVGLSFVSCYALEKGEAPGQIAVLSVPALKTERGLCIAIEQDRLQHPPVEALVQYLTSAQVRSKLKVWRKDWER